MKYVFKTIIILLMMGFSQNALSQNTIDSDRIISKYLQKLELNDAQKEKFESVLLKFSPQFQKENMSVVDYNALMKREALEIYEILSKEQFAVYKKLRKAIEPNKEYRIETNK